MEGLALFEQIVEEYRSNPGVAPGKMMSSPALQYQGKVFAFLHQEAMTFKLGKKFDPEAFGLREWSYLSPFKNKPPMQGWIVVNEIEKEQWPYLTSLAYEFIKGSTTVSAG